MMEDIIPIPFDASESIGEDNIMCIRRNTLSGGSTTGDIIIEKAVSYKLFTNTITNQYYEIVYNFWPSNFKKYKPFYWSR